MCTYNRHSISVIPNLQVFSLVHVKAKLPQIQNLLSKYSSAWFKAGTAKVEQPVGRVLGV